MDINKKKGVLVLIVILGLLQLAYAQEYNYVISNSENWRDVYSSMLYSSMKGFENGFLVSTPHGSIILNGISKDSKILVLTSSKSPYVFNYPDLIRSRGYPSVNEISSNNLNLRLASEFNDIQSYVIVGDSYGFNSVAVAPYSIATHSWVLFANKNNINDVTNFLDQKQISKILIYGYVDREVRDSLTRYNPEIIDNQDKFKDNIEIVKRYIQIKPDSKQVSLTNGEFLERQLLSGVEPVLFTGKQNVPDEIRDYLKNSQIEVGVLIGNDLVGAATNIRKTAGISVMVKFARGARSQSGGVAAVEGLDLFPLPTPSLNLTINSIKYNKGNSQLEITYKSNSNVPIYLKGTITILGGPENLKVGDLESIFIAPGDYKTISYSVDVQGSENLTADVFTLFGESTSSMDRAIQARFPIEIINVLDKCKFDDKNIKSVKYNKQKRAFIIKIQNNYPVDCYSDIELKDVMIGYSKQTLSSDGSIIVPQGKSANLEISQEMNSDDLDKNPEVDIILYSGERADSLVNVFKGRFPVSVESWTVIAYVTIILAVIITLLVIIIILLKRREKDED